MIFGGARKFRDLLLAVTLFIRPIFLTMANLQLHTGAHNRVRGAYVTLKRFLLFLLFSP